MSALTAPLIAWSRAFPADACQARETRRFLAAVLEGHQATDDALICLSELVTNAIVHSRSREPGGSFTIRAQLHGGCLRVEVTDQGGPWNPPAPTEADSPNGRGLLIVGQLAARWGRTGDQHAGWTLWYEMHTPTRRPNGATPSPASRRRQSAARYLTVVTANGYRSYGASTVCLSAGWPTWPRSVRPRWDGWNAALTAAAEAGPWAASPRRWAKNRPASGPTPPRGTSSTSLPDR